MKTLRYLFVTAFILASLPLGALAAPTASGLIAAAELHRISGAVCSSCSDDDGLGTKVTDQEVGRPYWAFTGQSVNQVSNGPWVTASSHYNGSSVPVLADFTFMEVNALNWSVSGGLPASVLQASLGKTYSKSESQTLRITVSPYSGVRLQARQRTTSETHFYSLFQDYSHSNRQKLQESTARVQSTSTETKNIVYK